MNMEKTGFSQVGSKFGLSPEWHLSSEIGYEEIADLLHQERPYLALQRASRWQRNGESGVLAEVRFESGVCDGHYPGSATIPLVDMGRVMDQAAGLTSNSQGKIPLLKRISKLRAESMEVARPDSSYWIWAFPEKGELITRLYSDTSTSILASIQGWEYDFAVSVDGSEQPRFVATEGAVENVEVKWIEEIDSERIARLIPQAPPFFVLQSAWNGNTSTGADVVKSFSSFKIDHVAGHLDGIHLLGPMHYARSLAQTGMLLAALVGGSENAVPEVVSAKTIWYDTREYFGPEVEVMTTVVCDRKFGRGGLSFVTMNGIVSVRGKAVLGTDSFVYVLLPRATHPATAQMKT